MQTEQELLKTLKTAVISNKVEDIRKLNPAENLLKYQDNFGQSFLHTAVLYESKEAIECLVLEFKANVNVRDGQGNTPFYRATYYGLHDIMRCLKNCDADVNIPDNNGITAMHTAALSRKIETIAVLAKLGANPNATDDKGKTPLDVIAFNYNDPSLSFYETREALAAIGAKYSDEITPEPKSNNATSYHPTAFGSPTHASAASKASVAKQNETSKETKIVNQSTQTNFQPSYTQK